MVNKLTRSKINLTRPPLPGLTSVGVSQNRTAFSDRTQARDSLIVGETGLIDLGPKKCLAELRIYTEESRIRNNGFKPGDFSHKQLVAVGHMEGDTKAEAARRLSHCQLQNEGDRGLAPDQYVAAKKREAIDLVMAQFNRWFDKRLEIISYAYDAAEASGNSTSNSGTDSGSCGSGHGQSSRSTRTKRRLGGNDQDDGSVGGNEGDPDRGGSKRAKKDTEPERKFACPFYKHDPKSNRKHRSCSGPGWASLHRLKEHLYRVHRLPKHACLRCYESFDDDKDLREHVRADVPCEKLDVRPVLEGIDDTTEAKLKVRKKNSPGMTDEQRWRDTYMILFPHANPNAIPTPYYDGNDSFKFSKNREEWKKVEKRIRKELPEFVQKKVEKSFERVEVEMLVRLPDIIRDGLFEFFRNMPHNDGSASATPAATPRARTPILPATVEQPVAAIGEAADYLLDLSNALEPNASFFMEGFDDIDSKQTGFGDFGEYQFVVENRDSGYDSTSTGGEGTVERQIWWT